MGLETYLLKDGKKHPVAIICPGGGYGSICSFLEGMPFAKALNKMGYSAVVVYYRVGEKAKFPAPQDDLARAVREIIDNSEKWNLETDCYSVWGSSAGGIWQVLSEQSPWDIKNMAFQNRGQWYWRILW